MAERPLYANLDLDPVNSVTSYAWSEVTSDWNTTEQGENNHDGYPFPSKLTWLHIVLSALVLGIIILFIIVGNILVVIAIAVDRNLNTVQNYFIASLAVSDLSLGALVMPLSLTKELIGYWFFGDTLCDIWLAVDVFLCTASILNLCLISLDRYWSVTRAVSYAKQRTARRALAMIAIAWSLALIICLPPLAGWKRPQTTHSDKYPSCQLSSEMGYVAYSALGSFFIPLTLMIVVYVKIYMTALARARRNLKRGTQATAGANGKADKSTSGGSLHSPLAANKLSSLNSPMNPLTPHSQHDVITWQREFSSYEDDDDDACNVDGGEMGAAGSGGVSRGHYRLAPVSEMPNSDSTADFAGGSDISDGGGGAAMRMHVISNPSALMSSPMVSHRYRCRDESSTNNDEHNRLLEAVDEISATADDTTGSGDTVSNHQVLQQQQLYVSNPNYEHYHHQQQQQQQETGKGSTKVQSYLTRALSAAATVATSNTISLGVGTTTTQNNGERTNNSTTYSPLPLSQQVSQLTSTTTITEEDFDMDRTVHQLTLTSDDEVGRSGTDDSKKLLLNLQNHSATAKSTAPAYPAVEAAKTSSSSTSRFRSLITRSAPRPRFYFRHLEGSLPKGGCDRGNGRGNSEGNGGFNKKSSILSKSARFQKFGSKIFSRGGSERTGDNGSSGSCRLQDDPERQRRKIAKQRERRATVVLGIVMATFICSWLPFFIVYPMSIFIGFKVPETLFAVIFWAGYCNSAMNPIIYTIFNREFRHAFYKILCRRRLH